MLPGLPPTHEPARVPRRVRFLTPLLLFALAVTAVSPARSASAPPSPLTGLGWMAGHWIGTQDGVTTEEVWTGPEGGLMLGMNKARRDGRAGMFEFLRIVARGDTIAYVAMPRGRNETPFPMKERKGQRVVFENLAHDFPQRIVYWMEKPDELHARTEGTIDGKLESEEWTWKRARPRP